MARAVKTRNNHYETDAGERTAGEYPNNVTVGESVNLTLGVRNGDNTATEYTVISQLQRVAATNGTASGRVLERTELHQFTPELAPEETWHRQHTVSPTFAGDRVRVVYLLYQGDPAAEPAIRNADREVHLWLDVAPEN